MLLHSRWFRVVPVLIMNLMHVAAPGFLLDLQVPQPHPIYTVYTIHLTVVEVRSLLEHLNLGALELLGAT